VDFTQLQLRAGMSENDADVRDEEEKEEENDDEDDDDS